MKNFCLPALVLFLIICFSFNAMGFETQPFKWDTNLSEKTIIISVDIEENHYLYADRIKIEFEKDSGQCAPELVTSPLTKRIKDDFSDEIDILAEGKVHQWTYSVKQDKPFQVTISYQGCRKGEGGSGSVCFMPKKTAFTIEPGE